MRKWLFEFNAWLFDVKAVDPRSLKAGDYFYQEATYPFVHMLLVNHAGFTWFTFAGGWNVDATEGIGKAYVAKSNIAAYLLRSLGVLSLTFKKKSMRKFWFLAHGALFGYKGVALQTLAVGAIFLPVQGAFALCIVRRFDDREVYYIEWQYRKLKGADVVALGIERVLIPKRSIFNRNYYDRYNRIENPQS